MQSRTMQRGACNVNVDTEKLLFLCYVTAEIHVKSYMPRNSKTLQILVTIFRILSFSSQFVAFRSFAVLSHVNLIQ